MMLEAEDWVAIAFVVFLCVLAYVGAHKKITEALDHRKARIATELEEASRLRAEAQALLADYQRRQQEAEREAASILTEAKAEAERIAAEARVRMEDFIARRTKMAETKISQAEAQALADVRIAAAESAVAAAEQILAQGAKGQVADKLIAQGIADLRTKLN
jgi:F-type H+-transporting ATPase subunit b